MLLTTLSLFPLCRHPASALSAPLTGRGWDEGPDGEVNASTVAFEVFRSGESLAMFLASKATIYTCNLCTDIIVQGTPRWGAAAN